MLAVRLKKPLDGAQMGWRVVVSGWWLRVAKGDAELRTWPCRGRRTGGLRWPCGGVDGGRGGLWPRVGGKAGVAVAAQMMGHKRAVTRHEKLPWGAGFGCTVPSRPAEEYARNASPPSTPAFASGPHLIAAPCAPYHVLRVT